MKIIKDLKMDEERALYRQKNIEVLNCSFDGPLDGESAIKECKNVVIKDTYFNLRYPLWRVTNGKIDNITMTENARSSVWYSKNMIFTNSFLHGVKIFRMCKNIVVDNCDIDSIEFGWNTKNIKVTNSKMKSTYPFLASTEVYVKDCIMDVNYPFQQVKNCVIEDTIINAKDTLWDSENVVVRNCKITGDFLAWHSKKLTFINCEIISSQPLCYVDGLTLIDCKMDECDLAFEYSTNIEAKIGDIISIKNPESGRIVCKNVKDVIFGNGINKTNAEVIKDN